MALLALAGFRFCILMIMKQYGVLKLAIGNLRISKKCDFENAMSSYLLPTRANLIFLL